MKILKIVLAILTLGLSLFIFPLTAKANYNEAYYTKLLIEDHNFKKGNTIKHRLRTDLYQGKYVIEVDWEHKVYEGIGQSLVYAHILNMKPGLVILDDLTKDTNYMPKVEAARANGIKVWIVQVKNGQIKRIIE